MEHCRDTAGRVESDAHYVGLYDVVSDLGAAVGTGETRVHPDASAETRWEKVRREVGALNREAVEHHVVSLNLHRSAGVVDYGLISQDKCPRPGVDPGLRAEERQIVENHIVGVSADGDLF